MRLADLDDPRRALATGLLAALACTWIAGEALLYRGYHAADGDPSLSVADLQERFTGGAASLLEARVRGEMREYLQGDEAAVLLAWARTGADERRWPTEIQPVLEDRCVRCHRATGEASFRPLDSYARVAATVAEAPAPALGRQLLVTKVHLAGLGGLLGVTSWLFSGSSAPEGARLAGTALAFGGLFADFGSWWLMRADLGFAWGRVLGNAAMTAAFAVMTTWCLVDLWWRRAAR